MAVRQRVGPMAGVSGRDRVCCRPLFCFGYRRAATLCRPSICRHGDTDLQNLDRWLAHSNRTPSLPGWAVRSMALPARRIVKGMVGGLIWLVNSMSRAMRVIFSPA